MLEDFLRPLTERERRSLEGRISSLHRELKILPARTVKVGLVIFGTLWILTILADRPAWPVITAFWVGIGGMLSVWGYSDVRRKRLARLRRLEDALHQNEARVVRIQSDEMVEFEEEEDEGACYAFQLDDGRIVFVSGQEFYPSAKFPNSNFSLVHILDETGALVEMLIDKHGERLKPIRTVSAQQKSGLRIPEHLQTIQGKLEDLERLLAV